jgi:SHS2 domain-containing protein
VVERERHVVEVEGADRVELMIGMLSELVFLLDARQLVPRRVTLLHHGPGMVRLAVFGEPLRDDDQIVAQVKAVTYHGAQVARDPASGRWSATVVVDV